MGILLRVDGWVLPAYAGMIRLSLGAEVAQTGAPRVCGDDPVRLRTAYVERGVLPAYAGMIPRRLC